MVLEAKANGFPAVAITDHAGVLYGAIEFYKAAKSMILSLLLAVKYMLLPVIAFEKGNKNEERYFHLTLLLKTISAIRTC